MQLSPDSIVITGLGMVSSLGLDVTSACAAARAGINRAQRIPHLLFPDEAQREMIPVTGYSLGSFSAGFTGLGRLVRLGTAALTDLLEYSNLPNDGRTGIVVNASSGFYLTEWEKEQHAELDKKIGGPPGTQEPYEMQLRNEHYAKLLVPRLARLSGMALDPHASRVLFRDQTGMTDAIRLASDWLKHRAVERCIIGGIDSYLEESFVAAFDHFGVIRKEAKPTGFLPGEAAAFVLLERVDRARRRSARAEAVLHEPQQDAEPFHRLSGKSATGAALSRVIDRALAALPDRGRRVGLTLAGLNGDEHRASDWGGALMRLRQAYPQLGQREWYPAESFGETGAAGGPVAICLGVRAIARGYAASDEILVWLTSDRGSVRPSASGDTRNNCTRHPP